MSEGRDQISVLAAPLGERTQLAHETTREAILYGKLEAGLEISQLELARRLGLSRTPLREALRLLEREGLVAVRGPRRLVQISPLTMPDLDDLYALRVAGESLALRLTVDTLGAEDVATMHRDLKLWELTEDPHVRGSTHRRFHAALRSGAGERLSMTLATLFEHAERYQRAYVVGKATTFKQKNAEHWAILHACERGERELAVDLLVDHIASTAQALMAAENFEPRALADAVWRAKQRRP